MHADCYLNLVSIQRKVKKKTNSIEVNRVHHSGAHTLTPPECQKSLGSILVTQRRNTQLVAHPFVVPCDFVNTVHLNLMSAYRMFLPIKRSEFLFVGSSQSTPRES